MNRGRAKRLWSVLVASVALAVGVDALAQAVIIENRGGAGGQIGTAFAVRSAPNGYTIVIGSTPVTINPSLYKNLPYDILNDFVLVSLVVMQPLVLVVHPSVPAQTAKELIALAKAQPGKLNYSSGGSGTGTHLAAELLKTLTGIDVVHVPYNGQAAALTAVLGRIDEARPNADSRPR